MNKYSNMLEALAQAPETQIDPAYTAKLAVMSRQTEVKSDDLLSILDDCAFFSGASDFAMTAMNVVWGHMLKDEGITKEQAFAAAEPRRKLREADL
jgi:hypothetical protein